MLTLIIFRTSSNLGKVGSKSRSLGQIFVKYCYHTRGYTFDPIFIKLAQSANIDTISDKFKYAWGRVKSRSRDQIFIKSCYHYRGHNFDTIFIKLVQNANIDNISDEFEFG